MEMICQDYYLLSFFVWKVMMTKLLWLVISFCYLVVVAIEKEDAVYSERLSTVRREKFFFLRSLIGHGNDEGFLPLHWSKPWWMLMLMRRAAQHWDSFFFFFVCV